MTAQQRPEAKPDLVMKYGFWFMVLGLIFGVFPMSIMLLHTGEPESVKVGIAGLVCCIGLGTFLYSLHRKD